MRFALWFAIWLSSAVIAASQTIEVPDTDITITLPSTGTVIVDPSTSTEFEAEQVQWEQVASRAETVLANENASMFSMTHLRSELIEWRDVFNAERSLNAGRIATVKGQIAALGTVPTEGATEAPEITARRDALKVQLGELEVPVLLAEESYARADGLIGEVDAQIRSADTASLTARGTPLYSPKIWAETAEKVAATSRGLGDEVRSRVATVRANGSLSANLPTSLLLLVVSVVLFAWGRLTASRLVDLVKQGDNPLRQTWATLLSLSEVIVPVIGLSVFAFAMDNLDILRTRGQSLVEGIVIAGVTILIARWLARQMFPRTRHGPLSYPIEDNLGLRRTVIWLGFGLGLVLLLDTFLQSSEMTDSEKAALLFPLRVLMAVLLFRLGQKMRQAPDGTALFQSSGNVRWFFGSAAMFVAVAVPVLSFLGFSQGAGQLFGSFVLTLAVLSVVILIQQMLHNIWLIWAKPENEQSALAPVLIGIAVFVLSIPVLALVWGARLTDLSELWTRFKAGVAVGDSTISPMDLLWMLAVFAIGYVLTRLIQGGLRNTILPRTKLDVGGQNAIVSGVGYVGFIVAAIAAISAAGVDLSSIALVAGALSVGIGFGLQNIVSNFVSGIILLIERPVSQGDWIEVNGQMGYVKDISVRSTRIETFDRTDVIVPNSDLVSGQVTNWTRGNSIGRIIVPVGVAYGTDVDKVHSILQEIVEAHPLVLLDPPPGVLFQNFGDSSLDFEIRAILRDVNFSLSVKSELNTAIAKRFEAEGIEIPFPQRDVWMRTASDDKEPKDLTPFFQADRQPDDINDGEAEADE